MKDFAYSATGLDQRASGTATVVSYAGLAGDTFTIDGNVLTAGVDWTAGTSNNATATSLAAAIDGLAGYTAAAVGAVVTFYYDTAGTGGNSKTIATSDATNLTLSGATLAGGVASTISDVFAVYNDDMDYDYVGFAVTIASYVSGTVTITPQVSYDNVTWFDTHALHALAADGSKDYSIDDPKMYVRFKIVLTAKPLDVAIKAATRRGKPRFNGSQDGAKTVTTAGTQVQLSATSVRVRNLDIQVKVGNAGSIYIGGPDVSNGGADGIQGVQLSTRHYDHPVDLSEIWIDADTNADGVTYTYEF